MQTQVINSLISETYMPSDNTIIIRITSNEDFAKMKNRSIFQDVLELRFDDVSPEHPKEDSMLYGAMKEEHFQEILKFVEKNKQAEKLIVHCDAGQSRSPAVAINILDYLLNDPEQAQELIQRNKHWKPNAHVTTFFRTAYYEGKI